MDGVSVCVGIAIAVAGWLVWKKVERPSQTTRETPEERLHRLARLVPQVIPAYGEIMEKWPLTIFPISKLPFPKEDMKTVIQAAWTKTDDLRLREYLASAYVYLANFREDISAPIDPRLPADASPTATQQKLEPFLVVSSQIQAEGDALMAEFREFEREMLGQPKLDPEMARKQDNEEKAAAFRTLGNRFTSGHGAAQDDVLAAKAYLEGAELGDVTSQMLIGLMYRIGKGVPENHGEAVKWLRKASEQGQAKAQSSLATMYADGLGVTQDYDEAAKWSRLAANQGDADGQMLLGALYNNGQGVNQDHVLAYKWLRRSADQFPEENPRAENKAKALLEYVSSQMTDEQLVAARKA